ncbi:hypothetical protein [Sphaerisporangium fuscum]|uniref:hypothetical protein n=1 Tax=Sphaerisporangium fuscum TaxID=2835868 RepID=UPI001BDD3904|nr:hypothetical protein [Sphaerisporangium fuscum]
MSGGSGKHRAGAPVEPVGRRRWDMGKRAAAAQLDQMEPAWQVTYGIGSRRFFAFALWNAPRPILLEAGTVEELRESMREAELGLVTAFAWQAVRSA